jgi:hypothetical protein
MKFQISTLLFITIFMSSAYAQNKPEEDNWAAQPNLHNIANADFLKECAVVVFEAVKNEYYFGDDKELHEYKKNHRIIRLNNEKGVEQYNKLKIRFRDKNNIKNVKARTVLSNGKVIELNAGDFKDVVDEDGINMKICAFEGVEKGCEIEYEYEMEKLVSYFETDYIQEGIPIVKTSFELVAPESLIFEMKGYNDVKVLEDTIINNHFVKKAVAENLPAIEDEKYATFSPHFARIEYKLSYNKNGNRGAQSKILTWNDAVRNVHQSYFKNAKKDENTVKPILNNGDFTKLSNENDRVYWIEDYVKTNYSIKENINEDEENDIEVTLKNKYSSEKGINYLMALLLSSAKIPFEIGYTTNRFQKKFDYSFENWENLQKVLFYFPNLKSFLAPSEVAYRLPYFPNDWANNDGVFCKATTIGEFTSFRPEKRFIPLLPQSSSHINHNVAINFSPNMDTAIIDLKISFLGYSAASILYPFVSIENDKKKEVAKDILSLNEKSERTENITWENDKMDAMNKQKPLVIGGTIYSTHAIEKAGNKFLFKIGEMIGRQEEIYQEKPRQFDIEAHYKYGLVRVIKVKMPNGYKINNLNDLKINKTFIENGKEKCQFVADYKMDNDNLNVEVHENYDETSYPKSQYEDFRKIINAAADFNKVILVLEKK